VIFVDRVDCFSGGPANQLRLWFASIAYALLCALRRIGLAHTALASATCATIRLKLLKLGALAKISALGVRRTWPDAQAHRQHQRLADRRKQPQILLAPRPTSR